MSVLCCTCYPPPSSSVKEGKIVRIRGEGPNIHITQCTDQRYWLPTWQALTLVSEIKPQTIRGPTDTANFDTYPKDIDIPPDELSNWDIDF
uniref:Uncharacterized protein n=1 Tax=Timema tahoe TaxID=61484 RepID=A0A7R9IRI4_9NEOP|nr:unnamed protein product [Timema tahoe]